MKSKTKLLSLASVVALGLVSCTNDELKEIYSGEEITFTTKVSRATPTTLKELDGFRVYADADGYSKLFINGLMARKKSTGSGDYELESKITWPVDVNRISFWAYGPENVNIKPNFTGQTQTLSDFTVASDMVNGGKDHKDLVVAYTRAERDNTSGMQVPLVFRHALSQIEVKIKKGDGYEEGRIVKVKGAWIVNVDSEGEFIFGKDPNDYLKWRTQTLSNYGRTLSEGTKLGEGVDMISNEDGGNNSSLMLLPQTFNKYVFENLMEASDVSSSARDSKPGAYILVLCRVETEHKFDATDNDTAVGPLYGSDGTTVVGHVHQLFPVTSDASGRHTFKADAYGYSCVPIEGTWMPGKKYVYTLEFCGRNSGAGVYPPEPLPDGIPEGEKRPDDKRPGDPVLDDPITFSVTVSDWVSNDNPQEDLETPMN